MKSYRRIRVVVLPVLLMVFVATGRAASPSFQGLGFQGLESPGYDRIEDNATSYQPNHRVSADDVDTVGN